MRGALLLMAAGLMTACAGARPKAVTTVSAEGWAPIGDGGLEHARDRALNDALRKAAETGNGVVVEGRTAVRNAVALETEVLTRSRAVVESWKVLEETVTEGILRLAIEAVVVQGRTATANVALKMTDERAASGVARAMEEHGIGIDNKARTLVTGTARSRAARASYITGTETFRGSTELVVSVDGAAARRIFEEASALDADPETAAAKAVEAAGYRAGLALAKTLLPP